MSVGRRGSSPVITGLRYIDSREESESRGERGSVPNRSTLHRGRGYWDTQEQAETDEDTMTIHGLWESGAEEENALRDGDESTSTI